METIQETKNLLRRVMAYNNEGVVKRISKDTGCTHEEAVAIFEDTKRFLYLCGVYNGGFAPSVKVDDGWHSFILYTKDYFDFCMNFFGKIVHHYPNGDDFDRKKGLQQIKHTLKVAHSVFGQLSPNWEYIKKGQLVMSSDCSSDNPCSSCSSTTNCQG